MKKTDINLLPKKKSLPVSVTLGIPLGIILLILIAAIGIILPKIALNNQKSKLSELEQQLTNYVNVDSDYVQKLAEYSKLQAQQKNYDDFTKSDKLTIDVLNKILSAKANSITIQNYTFGYDSVAISGSALSDLDIAKFEVAIRKLALFPEISLGTIDGADGQRNFSFTLTYKKDITTSEGSASK